MQSGIDSLPVATGRPVEEAARTGHVLMPLPIDHAGRHIEQRIHIRLLLAQVVEVSGIHIIIVMDQSPPERIGANTVHPTRQRRLVAGLVERLFHHLVVAENRQHRTELRMCIAHPNEPVALDPVPQVILHIEVYGISSRHPNAVEARITRAERAQVRNIPVGKFSANLLYGYHHIVFQQVDPHETESRIAGLRSHRTTAGTSHSRASHGRSSHRFRA